MSVYRPGDGITYRYDLEYRGRRYRGSTGQTKLRHAKDVEELVRQKVRRLGAPLFSEWARTYYGFVERRVRRPLHIKRMLSMVLRFWGAAPPPESGLSPGPDAPYHNLRLIDPILIEC